MGWDNLSEEERAAVLQLLRYTTATDGFPMSPRIRLLKSVLAKLDPESAPAAKPKPLRADPVSLYKPSILAQRKAKRRSRRG